MSLLDKKKDLPTEKKDSAEPTFVESKDNVPSKPSKEASEVTCCVVDYGSFICIAEKLAETYKKVYYYTPTSQEFYSIADLVKADGIKGVERVHDIFEPGFIDKIDLFVFPDIGYGGLQQYLRSMGKPVWGSMGADKLEILRTEFLKTLKKLGLPVIHTEEIKGLTALKEHLKSVENKWVKVNKYRGNMETWHHLDMEHSAPELDRLATEFGGLQDTVTFVVQDFIATDVECGYDGWCIDGEFPDASYQGYEKKNELYLGSLLKKEDLPDEVKQINEALAPLLKKFGYRNFFATEIRVKDGVPYFIDPTMRMPGQTGEQMMETCSNIADIVWHGAHGEMVKPIFKYNFAASATMHYTAGGEWSMIKIPKKIRQWVKPFHYCMLGDMCHFPPKSNDELGVILGAGDSIEEAIEVLMENVEAMKEEPIKCNTSGFLDLMNCIRDAEEHDIFFTDDKIPTDEDIIGIIR